MSMAGTIGTKEREGLKRKGEGKVSRSFYGVSIILILKPDKDIIS